MSSDSTTLRKTIMTAGITLAVAVFAGCAFKSLNTSVTEPVNTDISITSTEASESVTEEETTPEPTATPTPTPEPTATPTPTTVKVSFAGDCTLCSDARTYNHFDAVVKKRWDYPFKNCKNIFSNDDLTLVNCEMAITNSKSHKKKKFVFAMKSEGTKYFTHASIEAVNLANNHTLDFGQSGLKDTRKYLTKAGILWSDTSNYAIYTAKNGVKIGMCGYTSTYGLSKTYKLIKQLRAKGCQIVIVSCHWGIEAKYKQTKSQISRGRALINHGADIVVGTHPHRLQPIEVYKGKYILYSIGNFCFGGHTNPS
ncbi:MAG: CapA family protein, partial [Oscillospiraceae bacterium]|nr:CapA family protein [Oscillospiraceae bacterium]